MREAGTITICDPGSDKPILEASTLQCCHCGRHWVPRPGSGNTRGFCFKCNRPVCGPKCAECVPIEQLLENIEAGRPDEYTPTRAPVKLWLPGRKDD